MMIKNLRFVLQKSILFILVFILFSAGMCSTEKDDEDNPTVSSVVVDYRTMPYPSLFIEDTSRIDLVKVTNDGFYFGYIADDNIDAYGASNWHVSRLDDDNPTYWADMGVSGRRVMASNVFNTHNDNDKFSVCGTTQDSLAFDEYTNSSFLIGGDLSSIATSFTAISQAEGDMMQIAISNQKTWYLNHEDGQTKLYKDSPIEGEIDLLYTIDDFILRIQAVENRDYLFAINLSRTKIYLLGLTGPSLIFNTENTGEYLGEVQQDSYAGSTFDPEYYFTSQSSDSLKVYKYDWNNDEVSLDTRTLDYTRGIASHVIVDRNFAYYSNGMKSDLFGAWSTFIPDDQDNQILLSMLQSGGSLFSHSENQFIYCLSGGYVHMVSK